MSHTTRRTDPTIDPGTDPDLNSGDRLWEHLLLDVSNNANEEAEQFVECFDTDQQGE